VERIFAIKDRPAEKPLPRLVPDPESVRGLVSRVPLVGHRLMRRAWPGALTLILGPGDGIAVRAPDHDFARVVLRASSGVVCATSANASGEPPLPEGIDLVVDGGPVNGTESTIARVSDDGDIEILRTGALSEEDVQSAAATTIAFVCTGNTCRSPMAEAVLRHVLATELDVAPEELLRNGFRVVSAGVEAWGGSPITPEAADALEDAGIPVPSHRSQGWTPELAGHVDRAYAMTRHHLFAMGPDQPPPRSLLDPSGHDIPDPIGCGPGVYRECLQRLITLIRSRVPEIFTHAPPS
jgi:protein-tyrosine phosphatase